MAYWDIIFYIDLTLFIFVSLTVLYMGVFALASMLNRHSDTPKAKRENRFIILIPAYRNGIGAEQTARPGSDIPATSLRCNCHRRSCRRDEQFPPGPATCDPPDTEFQEKFPGQVTETGCQQPAAIQDIRHCHHPQCRQYR